MPRRCVTRHTAALEAQGLWVRLIEILLMMMEVSSKMHSDLFPTFAAAVGEYEATHLELYEATYHKPMAHSGRCSTIADFEDKFGSDACFEYHFRLDKAGVRAILGCIGMPATVRVDYRPNPLLGYPPLFNGFEFTNVEIVLMNSCAGWAFFQQG